MPFLCAANVGLDAERGFPGSPAHGLAFPAARFGGGMATYDVTAAGRMCGKDATDPLAAASAPTGGVAGDSD